MTLWPGPPAVERGESPVPHPGTPAEDLGGLVPTDLGRSLRLGEGADAPSTLQRPPDSGGHCGVTD